MYNSPFRNQFGQLALKWRMEMNGLVCEPNMPLARERKFDSITGVEVDQSLPEYAQVPMFLVDEYPAAPENWERSNSEVTSYFFPIKNKHGLWLDFNANSSHSHFVAVVISVQGINPLTGMPTPDIRLEQYKTRCPKHNLEFEGEHFCPECKYKWPAQNYLTNAAAQQKGGFWLDGFRSEDGQVRQYVFTEKESEGVAAQIVGKDRVYAIGIAFYLSKEPKPVPKFEDFGRLKLYESSPYTFGSGTLGGGMKGGPGILRSQSLSMGSTRGDSIPRLEVGAGAKIRQQVYPDPNELDFWQKKPAAVLYANYCPIDAVLAIVNTGTREEKPEGFLDGLTLAGQNDQLLN